MLFAVLYAFNYLVSYGCDALIKKLNIVMKKEEPENTAIAAYTNFIELQDKQDKIVQEMQQLLNNDDDKYF